MVVTSHKLGDLQALADDVVFLHEGRVRFSGPLDELLQSTGRLSLEEAIADLMRGAREPIESPTGDTRAFTNPEARTGRLRIVR